MKTSHDANDELPEPPVTATRPCFADPNAFKTPVNGYKVLFPPPPSPFPTSDLSPIADIPSSQEMEAAQDGSAAEQMSTAIRWRGSIVEEDVDAFMSEVLTPGDRGSTSIDDIEMSF